MTNPTSLFFYGTLRHAPLLRAVLGRGARAVPARLADHAVSAVQGAGHPMIVARQGATADGVLVEDLTSEDLARLDFYEGFHGYNTQTLVVETDAGAKSAQVYFPNSTIPAAGHDWDFAAWQAQWGETVARAAEEVMDHRGVTSAADIARSYPQILMRAASALRAAAEPAPTTLRSDMPATGVEVAHSRRPYMNYFAVTEQDLRFPRYNGGKSETVTRAAFLMADAVTVLPYDPVRDRVLVIEQFRYGPYLRGDPTPWLLEPIAGRIDPRESAEDAVRREAREEAGVSMDVLHHISSYYPSPGGMTEYLLSYVGIAELPDDAGGIGGLEDEHEDIRAHVISFDHFMTLVNSGEVTTGPLVLTAYWLALNRAKLA